jgi:hypothetical protein
MVVTTTTEGVRMHDDDITERLKYPGRIFRTSVVGDTADEIELAALDEARVFFGDGRQLEVVHDYQAIPVELIPRHAQSGKKYTAEVCVRTVEP